MKHLKIEQNTGSIEVVDPKVIDKLYNLVLFHPVGETLDVTSNLKGNLQCSHAYGDVVNYLTTNYPDLQISVTGGIYIRFNDTNVESICATNWGDGTGITTVQASVVSDMSDKFASNTTITQFDELKSFINLKMNNNGTNFNSCTALTSIDLSNITKVGTVGNYFPYVFKGCTNLQNVIFNTNTESIGTYTFDGCTNFNTILPTSIKYLGTCALRDSGYSHDVNLPNLIDVTTSVTDLNQNDIDNFLLQGWFANTKITKVLNLGSITKLSKQIDDGYVQGTFSNCKLLQTVILPTTLLSIGSQCFRDCSVLTSITGMQNVEYIHTTAFYQDTLLSTIDDVSKVTYIGSSAFNNCSALTSLNLSTACSTINDRAFQNCTSLISVGDLSNVTSIGDDAFNSCILLTTAAGISGVTSLGSRAFSQCKNLAGVIDISSCITFGSDGRQFELCNNITGVILSNTTNVIEMKESWFEQCWKLQSFTFFKNVSSVNNFQYMFIGCSAMTTLTFWETSTSKILGKNFCNGCVKLATLINFPQDLTEIRYNAFFQCPITSISLNEGITTLGYQAFAQTKLDNITLPSTLTTMGGSELSDTTTPRWAKCLATTPPNGCNAWSFKNGGTYPIYVPDASLDTYKAASGWSNFSSRLKALSTWSTDFPNG